MIILAFVLGLVSVDAQFGDITLPPVGITLPPVGVTLPPVTITLPPVTITRPPVSLPRTRPPITLPPIPSTRTCFEYANLLACSNRAQSKICRQGEEPVCNSGQLLQCPSCFPINIIGKFCNEPPTVPCTSRMNSSLNVDRETGSICPSCFIVPDVTSCTEKKKKECLQKINDRSLPQCAPFTKPSLTNDCCFSCAIPIPTSDCSSKVLGTCPNSSYVDLRDSDGCRECIPETPERPVNGTCSDINFRAYRKATPECALNEKPTSDRKSKSCGPPCVRPASKKHLLEVIACRDKLDECPDDDRSKRNVFFPGQACPICEPKKPVCEKCDNHQICVRDRGSDKKKCVRKRRIVLRIKFVASLRNQLRNASKDGLVATIKELLTRFCERNGEVARCERNLDRILDSLNCTARRAFDDAIEVDLEVAEGNSGDDESAELLEDAVRDDSSYVTMTESTPPSNIPPEKMCFVPDTIIKCKTLGVQMPFCEDARPKCERKEVTHAGKNFLMVCPSCLPQEYVGHLCKAKVQPCTKIEIKKTTPVWNQAKKSLCPNCFQIPKEDECTWEDKKMCLNKLKSGAIPECIENEVAIREGCCFSCQVTVRPQKDKCQGVLPDCESPNKEKADIRDAFKKIGQRDANGCRKCAPKGPIRKKGLKCSVANFQEYKESAPSCASGEPVIINRNSTRCGPPCIRQASKKNLLQVIACLKRLRECEDEDESNRLIYLPNAACPICEPKKPKCNCQDKQICVRDSRKGQGAKKCINKKKIVMKLKLKSIIANETQNLPERHFTRLLMEFVERFCERNSQAERCAVGLDAIRDSLNCTKKTKTKDDEVNVEVELGEVGMTTGRRLLEEDTTISLLIDASKDDSTYVSDAELKTDIDVDPEEETSASSSSIFLTTSFLLSIFGMSQF